MSTLYIHKPDLPYDDGGAFGPEPEVKPCEICGGDAFNCLCAAVQKAHDQAEEAMSNLHTIDIEVRTFKTK